MYTITSLLSDIAAVTHGTTTNKIPGIYQHINRAARQILLDIDPKETQRIVELTQVFNDVYDYPCPVDLKGDREIDLRIQAKRTPRDVFTQEYAQTFDANKLRSLANKIYTQWNTGIKTLRIEAPTLQSPLTLCDTSTITGWSATAGAQNISFDSTLNVAGGGAIQFDLAAGSATGSIQINSLTPIDVTGHVNIDTEFYWVYLPTASSITNLDLKWGSDYTANYYHLTVTTTQQGTAFVNGWNLIALPWKSATLVGTPVITAYDSIQLTVTYDTTLQTGVKFCNLTSNTGSIFELQYYSKYIFRNPSTNAFVESIPDGTFNTYLINLDTESYNLLFNKTVSYIAQALQGSDSQYDATYWDSEYQSALKRYKGLNPSEAMLKGSQYYKLPRHNRRGFGLFRGFYNN
jgi:hypothetical protein